MSPQVLALVTSVSYAAALICSRRGLKYSTPTTVTGFDPCPECCALARDVPPNGHPTGVLDLRRSLCHRRDLSAWSSSSRLYRGLENRGVAQQRAAVNQSPDQR